MDIKNLIRTALFSMALLAMHSCLSVTLLPKKIILEHEFPISYISLHKISTEKIKKIADIDTTEKYCHIASVVLEDEETACLWDIKGGKKIKEHFLPPADPHSGTTIMLKRSFLKETDDDLLWYMSMHVEQRGKSGRYNKTINFLTGEQKEITLYEFNKELLANKKNTFYKKMDMQYSSTNVQNENAAGGLILIYNQSDTKRIIYEPGKVLALFDGAKVKTLVNFYNLDDKTIQRDFGFINISEVSFDESDQFVLLTFDCQARIFDMEKKEQFYTMFFDQAKETTKFISNNKKEFVIAAGKYIYRFDNPTHTDKETKI